MAENWANTYKQEGLGGQTTIQNHTPGQKLARAITEIQAKAVTRVSGSGGITVSRNGNAVTIGIDEDERESEDVSLDSLSLVLADSSLQLRQNSTVLSLVPVVDITLILKPGVIV